MNSFISSTICLFCLFLLIRGSLSESDTFSSWSPWINRHKPSAHAHSGIHGDETEHLTAAELKLLCPAATVTDIECVPDAVTDGQLQQVTCDVTSGLRCKGADNLPSGCYDYKIRYFCKREYSKDSIVRRRRASSGMIANCNTWSAWVNDNHPSAVDRTDHENMTRNSLDAFCPPVVGGSLNKLECQDDRGEPLTSDYNNTVIGYFAQCSDAYTGFRCLPWDPNITCPDFSFRYYCDCPLSATNPPSTSPGSTTVAVVASTHGATVRTVASGGSVTQTTGAGGAAIQGGTDADKADNTVSQAASGKDTGCNLADWLLVIVPCSVLLLLNLLISVCLYRKLGNTLRQRGSTRTKVRSLENV